MKTVAKTESKSLVKTIISCAIAIAFILLALFLPPPEGLSLAGWRAIWVLCVAVTLWVSEVVPNIIASLTIIVLVPLLGIMDQGATFSATGQNGMFFMLACFGIAAAFANTNLPKLLLRLILRIVGNNSKGIVFGFVVIAAVVSVFIADGAAITMVAALGASLLALIGAEKGKSGLGKGIMIGAVYGGLAGGVMFPMSGISNVVGISLINSMGYDITFGQWAILGIPVSIVSVVVTGWLLVRWCKPEKLTDNQYQMLVDECKGAKIGSNEIKLFVIIACMMYCFIFTHINMALVAAGGAIAMMLPGIRLCTGEDYRKNVMIDAVMLLACINPLITAFSNEGVGAWLCNLAFKGAANWNWLFVVFMICLMTMVVHFFVPGSAPVNGICLTVMLPVALLANVSPLVCGFCIFWFAAPIWFMPTDACYMLTYGFGYYKFRDIFSVGWKPQIAMFIYTVGIVGICHLLFGI
ncbi:MAG: SLC13 family permease [Oscillospiraceae bacterium]